MRLRIDRKPWGTFKHRLACTDESLYNLPVQGEDVVTCLECIVLERPST